MQTQRAHLLSNGVQLAQPGGDLLAEGRGVAVGGHAPERHLRVLQVLHQLGRLRRLRKTEA